MADCGIACCTPASNNKEPLCPIRGCPDCKVPKPCVGCGPKCCNTFLDFPILKRPICRGKCSCCSPWKKHEATLYKRQIARVCEKPCCLCGHCNDRPRIKPIPEPIPILRCNLPQCERKPPRQSSNTRNSRKQPQYSCAVYEQIYN